MDSPTAQKIGEIERLKVENHKLAVMNHEYRIHAKRMMNRLILMVLTSILLMIMIVLISIMKFDNATAAVFNTMVGFVGGAFLHIVSYYFGDSEGNQNKKHENARGE